MGLKKLDEIKEKEEKFIKGANRKALKKGKIDAFSKQTVNLDKSRHLKVKKYCAENKTSFQDFVIELIDNFFNK
jgi:TRAP-type C4-dicarboxylate transport system substrate-binding protein